MIEKTFLDVVGVSWPSLISFLIIYALIRITYILGNKKEFKFYKELMNFVMLTYILLLFELLTISDTTSNELFLVPFSQMLDYSVGTPEFARAILGNIILFIPFGFLISFYLQSNKSLKIISTIILSSVTIELIQYFTGRGLFIDDIILNLLGGLLGYFIFIALDAVKKHLPKFLQKEFLYNLLSLIFVGIIVLYVLYLFGIWSF